MEYIVERKEKFAKILEPDFQIWTASADLAKRFSTYESAKLAISAANVRAHVCSFQQKRESAPTIEPIQKNPPSIQKDAFELRSNVEPAYDPQTHIKIPTVLISERTPETEERKFLQAHEMFDFEIFSLSLCEAADPGPLPEVF